MPLLIPLIIAGAGALAIGGTAGYVTGGGVKAGADVIKYATIAGLIVGGFYVYKKLK